MRFVISSIVITGFLFYPLIAGISPLSQTWNQEDAQLRFAMISPVSVNTSQALSNHSETQTIPLKNPKLGVLMSALVPGAGQMYTGSWIKGVVFFGAEVALWMGYNHYRHEGDRLKTEFRAFANEHWIEAYYWIDMADQANLAGVTTENYTNYLDGENGLREYERLNHSHSLHRVKDQQYYEMIGKYYQFENGWDDFNPELQKVSPNRSYYENLEYRTDSQYRHAGTCAMVALGNHLISAFDAAWTVHRYNKSLQIKPQMGMMRTPREWIQTTGVALNW